MSEPITRADANRMALEFLRDHGAHTIGPINDDGALAAAMLFLDLTKAGQVTKTDFGGGHLQFAISPAGLLALDGAA